MSAPPPRDPADSLDFLAMAHYAVGALWAMLSLVPVSWVLVAHELARASGLHPPGQPPPTPPSALATAAAVGFVLVGFLGAALAVWGGRCLATRRRLGVARAAALGLCLFVPIGTVLGARTWTFLRRAEIRDRFAG